MNLSDYKKIGIIGYRNKGRQLYIDLLNAGKDIVYIIERNYEALRNLEQDMVIPIVGFNENIDFYNKADVLILSGDINDDIIYECLDMVGISINTIKNE